MSADEGRPAPGRTVAPGPGAGVPAGELWDANHEPSLRADSRTLNDLTTGAIADDRLTGSAKRYVIDGASESRLAGPAGRGGVGPDCRPSVLHPERHRPLESAERRNRTTRPHRYSGALLRAEGAS
jgi:hypothetical protein